VGLLLVLAGALFALIFLLIAIIRTLSKSPKITFVELLLAFLAALLPLAGVIEGSMGDTPAPQPLRLAMLVGIVLVVAGIVIALLELRREQKLKQSRGVFSVGIGVLVMLATFTVPITSRQILLPALATVTPINVAALQTTPTLAGPTRTATTIPSATATPTPTITRTPRPTGTATATLYVFVTSTPLPTATLPSPCLALTKYNVNLRAQPDANATVETTIPFDNTVALYGHSEDSVWWYGEYDGKQGWMKAEFLSLTASCDKLPVKQSE
jgi:hypothetical protein